MSQRGLRNSIPLDDEDKDKVDPALVDLGKSTGTLSAEARSAKSILQVRESTVSMVIVYLPVTIRRPSVGSFGASAMSAQKNLGQIQMSAVRTK